ncbi:hypothetical protein [Haemophilus influenzae]|uniref:Uncharacterized protein n=1 Tax=Haemophilus influenzae R3021 TaxID=375432 RepID=A4N2U7_HAEIF|nr:hypothetical protein [Haemophilus influenzae]EDJ91624.1 hypothetical protein CGSHi22421_07632 [Haemophilus influenzae R3021]
MKEFNLKAALNGEPVMLRNGGKAVVKYNLLNEVEKLEVRDTVYPLIGYRFDGIYINTTSWNLTGKSVHWATMEYDIIGMWEDPKLTSEQVLEKACNEDLLVLCDGNPDLPLKVIAKTKNGEFVMQPEDGIIQPWLANLTMEWFFVKKLDPKFDTSTLPKPFKPHIGDEFFYLSDGVIRYFSFYADCAANLMINGQCFRTKEDAQKWLDFMKSMLE